MGHPEYYGLINAIVAKLSSVSANELPSICSEYGLDHGTPQEATNSKKKYLRNRIEGKSSEFVRELAEKVISKDPDPELVRLLAVYKHTGVKGRLKNLIFASTGYKPEIVFVDSISNDIKIVKNEESCLVYDEAFPSDGLRWSILVQWYAKLNNLPFPDNSTNTALRERLMKAAGSVPEQNLLRAYYTRFAQVSGKKLPALVPQVYLHYDPKTVKELNGERRVPRHRMDFLLLFSHSERIVIEVDGQQHYSELNKPSPKMYGEMVSADRDLKLDGYEVYRFGGSELQARCDELVETFFRRLFKKHGVQI